MQTVITETRIIKSGSKEVIQRSNATKSTVGTVGTNSHVENHSGMTRISSKVRGKQLDYKVTNIDINESTEINQENFEPNMMSQEAASSVVAQKKRTSRI